MEKEFDKIENLVNSSLGKLGFKVTENWDGGMHKTFKWSNQNFSFCLLYDRGLYECKIIMLNNVEKSYDLIWLLRLFKDDKSLYQESMESYGMWKTLPVEDYCKLFISNFEVLSEELLTNSDLCADYDMFVTNSMN